MIGKDAALIAGIGKRRISHGLVFGKFMPPTKGHQYLIDFARASCEKLSIVIGSLPDEPIPGALRFQWLKEIFPDCDVVHLDKVMPQEPSHPEDHPFFQLWADELQKCCPTTRFEALFASEPYGYKMADVMKIRFIPVDAARDTVKISATSVRKNPFLHWDYLPPVVRPYFLKRISVTGSHSPEKAAFTRKLAAHFGALHVTNYAETLADDFSRNLGEYKFTLPDVSTIARGQMACEEALARQSRKLLFVDSDLTDLAVWSQQNFNTCPRWVEEESIKRVYDLYLATEQKAASHRRSAALIIEGDWDSKFIRAVDLIYEKFPTLKS